MHPFGARPASSNSGQIANALIDIWSAETKNDALFFEYEDNINCFCFSNIDGPFHQGEFSYAHDNQSILDIVSPLNVPWHPEKSGKEFLTQFCFIGFA